MLRTSLIRPVPELLAEHAEHRGTRLAFADAHRRVTYAELADRTRRIAGHLAGLRVQPGDRVAIYLGNRVETVESYLAVTRAAAIGVPLNPHSTDAELGYFLDDSGARVVITDPAHVEQLVGLCAGQERPPVLVVTGDARPPVGASSFEAMATTEPEQPARDDLDLDDVAWMLYTSGTTGQPKGVLSTQRNCLWSVAACYVPVPDLTEYDRVLWPLPLFHSLSHIACVLGVTAVGAFARITDGYSAEEVLAAMRAESPTLIAGVPTMYHFLVRAAHQQGFAAPDLRVGLVGGAVTTADLRRSVEETFGVPLLDAYGSTETCGSIAINWPSGARVEGSCGLPVPGLNVRLVDPESGRDVPAAAEGEVWVRGPNVMVGYHNRPEETAAALRDGWYRTGDLARRDDAGYLTVSGRIRDVVIRGGENIHPAEVEDAIRAVRGVADVAVAGKPHPVFGEVVVAFVVPGPGGVDSDAVFAACRERLAMFKVPEELYEVAAVPRTRSGKVTRHVLLDAPARLVATGTGQHEQLLRVGWAPVSAGPAMPLSAATVLRVPTGELMSTVDIVARDVRAWLDSGATGRLVVVTGGGVRALPDELPDPVAAAVAGLVSGYQAEHGDRVVSLDLPAGSEVDATEVLLPEAGARFAVREGVVLAPAAERVPLTATAHVGHGRAVVVGADTAEGAAVARHLVGAHGVRELTLVAASGQDDPVVAALAEELPALARAGRVSVAVAACAGTDHAEVARVVRGAGTPSTVVHVASGDLAAVAHGVAAVDVAGAHLVLLSPATAVGVPGDPAVGALLDAFAVRRRAGGRPALSLSVGPWEDDTADLPGTTGTGVGTLTRRDLLTALDAALMSGEPAVLAVALDTTGTADAPALLRGRLDAAPAGSAEASADTAARLRAGLADLTPADRLAALVDLVRAAVTDVRGDTGVEADRAFREIGFTSLQSVSLRDRVVARTGLALPVTLAFDHPTPLAVAACVLDALFGEAAAEDHPVVTTHHDDEPVAIVGMACRLPGGIGSPEELWEFLLAGGDGITPFPTDRGWDVDGGYDPDPEHPGTSYVRDGGFLTDAAGFDAEFFGISPREALAMDPQQRQFLEVAWEAFERAGIDMSSLRGSRTGVFAGAMNQDYGAVLAGASDDTEGYRSTGANGAVVSGRVAYTFGFEGPAVTVDTACSSSLVALHLAGQSLRSGESDLAVAGGVAVMALPSSYVEFSRQRGLAADGRCKPFAAAADGTGWAEGVAVLVLERLSDARRNGHGVLAVVAGTAVNSDGASNGLTAPNGVAQQRVVRQALAAAGLRPSDVDVVEAHGTGTRLGDPIEALALIATYGQDRQTPLWLGSLKSNIGHTQAAAGVAGVIKSVLAMRHGVLPRTLHVDAPTPHVDWSAGAVELLTENRPWPEVDRPRRAGVSAFGVSGTNAHVILEQAPDDRDPDVSDVDGVTAWTLSAATPAALSAAAARLATHVEDRPDLTAAEVARTLAERSRLTHRAVVLGADREALVRGTRALADGAPDPSVVAGEGGADGKTVFVFPGQGTQWVGMGAGLLESSPVFAEAVAECETALSAFVDWSVTDVIRQAPGAPGLDRVDVVQPMSFVMMVSLARLWRHHGVRPDAVMGHSQGEIAAAHVAGALSLADAARIVALRSQAIAHRLAGKGGMMSVALPVTEIGPYLDGRPGLSLATVNGPSSVVVAGDPAAVEELRARLSDDGVRCRVIAVDYASHTSHVERIEDELRDLLAPVTPAAPVVPMWSTTDGAWVEGPALDGRYWYRNLRQTVHFADGTAALAGARHALFVEVSTHPVLTAAIEDTLASRPGTLVVPTLRRDQDEPLTFHTALATVHTGTATTVDWRRPATPPATGLPTYPFQHKRFWPTAAPAATTSDPAEARFWAVVDEEDVTALAATLDADAATREALSSVLPAIVDWRRRARRGAETDGWRYRVTWRRIGVVTAERLSGRWLAVVPAGGHPVAEAALDALRTRGAEVARVEATGDGFADLDAALAREPRAVLSFLALDESPHPAFPTVPRGLAGLTDLLRALDERGTTAPVWAFTSGAIDGRPTQALTWGLGLVAALEHPRRWGGVVDLPAEPDDAALRHLPAVLLGQGDEDQLALRADGVLGRRLVRAPLHEAGPRTPWVPRGTVVVTGGTGGVGGHVCRWLAEHGADHVLLLSRRGADADGAAALAEELTAAGARVTITACDVTSRDDLAAALAGHDVTAVVHAAGVGQRTPLADTDPAELSRVLSAKVAGARNLDEVLGDRPLDAFVLISSNAGVWGGGGQGAYAAANAYLDTLAVRRRAQGRPATSIAWGSWAGAGLGAVDGAEERLRRLGLPAMDPGAALAALVAAVEHGETTVSVADVRWDRFAPGFTAARPSALLSELPEVRDALREQEVEHTGGWAERLAALPETERDRAVLAAVTANAAAVLGHTDATSVAPDKAFTEQGFDSMTAVQLRNALVREFGLRLPTTLLFDRPTARALAGYVRAELTGTTARADTPAVTARRDDEPIAIVGMACRLPGGIASPADLWALLMAEGDVQTEFPADRGWDTDAIYDPEPGLPGRTYTRQGGFLDTATQFDPSFFGISPREALGMDPQHRVFLETAWETFERAGIDVSTLRGSKTGVFAGAFHTGYTIGADLVAAGVDGYTSHNNLPSVLSGRVAYTFGFEGPAVTVDTACSSSLVAVHLAGQSLRTGESDLALAGGVAVMARPNTFIEFSRQRGLATDGRCKAFATAADGTGWSEGVALLVLERLSDARRNGHSVLAVVAGSAVNSDGTSNGLTAPNGLAQQRVIRAALASAGLRPSDVDVVEAHGTGTTLGDPIEAQALLAAYGQEREIPLWLGSLKSNIGHTQTAAGVAGMIKTVLAMRHGVLPRTLHVDAPTPHVDWSAGAVELLTEARPWPEVDRPRRAGVSAFGVSGTNAHVILEQAPDEVAADDVPETAPVPLTLSARTPAALAESAARLADHVSGHEEHTPTAIAARLTARVRHEHRAVVVGADRETLVRGLRALAAGTPDPAVVAGTGTGVEVDGPTVFVFPGQGTQWAGMGAGLLESSPVFAEAVAECEVALSAFVDWSVTDVIRQAPGAPSMDRVDVVQPVSFVMMVSLARLWGYHGVRPDAVVGHSQGEIAAAYVAGALSLVDAARVVALRSQAIARHLAGHGAMMSVALPLADVEPRVVDHDGLSVATVNGPSSVVVAGDPDAVEELRTGLSAEGVRTRVIRVDYASHTSHVERIEDELRDLLAPVRPQAPTVPMWSSTDSAWLDGPVLTGEYWYRNLRGTVRFRDAVEALASAGHRLFVEVSTHPVLTAPIEETLEAHGDVLVVPTLRRDQHEPTTFHTALATVHTATAVRPDWRLPAVPTDPDTPLPTYPFQHERFWLDTGGTGDLGAVGLGDTGHPLLGAAVHLPDGGAVFTNRVTTRTQPWLTDHAVAGTVLFPGSALLELAVRAGDEVGVDTVAELVVEAPLVVPDRGVHLRVTVGAEDDGRRPVAVHTRTDDDATWTRHAVGQLTAVAAPRPAPAAWPPAGAHPVAVDDFYEGQREVGMELGPLFQGLRRVWTREDEVFAEVEIPATTSGVDGFVLHPALLDAALHAAAYLPGRGGARAAARLPFAWTGVTCHAAGATALRVHLRAEGDDVAVELADGTGAPVATVTALATRPVDPATLFAGPGLADMLYRTQWRPLALPERGTNAFALLDLTARASGTPPEQARELVLTALKAIQAHLSEAGTDPLVVVTRDARTDPAAGAVWGLARTAQSEHPGRVVLVDTDAAATLAALPAAVATGEPQLALRDGTATVPRLVRHTPAQESTPLVEDGTVLVTGGTGTLGALVARRLVTHHGVRHLLLTSRRGAEAPGAADLRAELTGLGATVTIAPCDLGDRAQVKALLSGVPAAHPLTAVLHSAAALDDGVVTALDATRVEHTFAPKVDGAWHLHELTEHLDLAAFVLFSSASGTLGNAGQGNYAAANGFLDGLAGYRRDRGLPAGSLSWGLWVRASELTAEVLDGTRGHRKDEVLALSDDEGLRLFDATFAKAGDPAVLAPVKLGIAALRMAASPPAVVRDLLPRARRVAEAAAPEVSFVAELAAIPPADRHARLVELVRGHAAATLGHADPASIEDRQPFRELGFDSLAAVDLRNRVGAATSLRLPATLVFDHPSPAALASHLLDELGLADGTHGGTDERASAGAALALAEVDRLDATLSRLLGDGTAGQSGDHVEVVERLRRLASRWRGTGDAVTDDMTDDMTDDDILALAEAELS
ncbi:type I polyketide synthase [Actinophytocola sp.]|uniref:type I polyketide synthase n=1 Tax=Actinophytocola sp. TaxID=1872138 RepID=UPI002D682678|nr:SDR family NAD(P)-dependent oxidoreductase [Actinophytocola sp.]HYQ68098.1 SDR family NAD(P)-dependent oxidoreductase [Actinophytocola sp.]